VLDPTNKGFQMMAKLGFRPGDTLGKTQQKTANATGAENDDTPPPKASDEDTKRNEEIHDWVHSRAEPLRLIVKEDRGGIGLDSEKKRKFRAEADEQIQKSARVKAEEGEYRERMRTEREERRLEAQVVGAQKVAEKLDTENEDRKKGKGKKVNILYRGLVREREDKEREKMVRAVFENSISTSSLASYFPKPRLPTYNDPSDEDVNAHHALQNTEENITFVEQDAEGDTIEEDEELNEFNVLPVSERLDRLVAYMRETYFYCFWCKHRYDEGMEGCPGLTEEDHD
jgi:Domain of unknown function (DUF4187)/G-patch domain